MALESDRPESAVRMMFPDRLLQWLLQPPQHECFLDLDRCHAHPQRHLPELLDRNNDLQKVLLRPTACEDIQN